MTTRLIYVSPQIRRFVCITWLSLLPLFIGRSVAEAARFNHTLDDGVTVVVIDNYSVYSDAHAANLATGADRSTQDDGMFYRPRKGLIPAGSRILVRTKYMAWFYEGMILGYWTLNPATGLYAHMRSGPNFSPWAHSELLRGSASPQQQLWFWDMGSPGIEYSMGFDTGSAKIVASHYAGYYAPNGNWSTIYDGAVIGADVYYATSTRISAMGSVDVVDGNDANGIQNYVESQVGYVAGPDDMRVVWRFRAVNAAVAPYNTFYWIWANYSVDNDGAFCDQSPANYWPDQVWGRPTHYQSSLNSASDVGNGFAPYQIGALVQGVPCQALIPGMNHPGRYTVEPLVDGSFIRWGEDPSLAAGTPRWTLTHKVDAAWGVPIQWNNLAFVNESIDGVWGGGGGILYPVWQAGVWYTASYILSSQ